MAVLDSLAAHQELPLRGVPLYLQLTLISKSGDSGNFRSDCKQIRPITLTSCIHIMHAGE